MENNIITESTNLVVMQDWITPYNSIMRGDFSTAKYWASKLGVTTKQFIDDFNNGKLCMWFKVY